MPREERAPLAHYEYTPMTAETIPLPFGGTLHLEHYANEANNVAAVVGHWGIEWSRAQVEEQIRQLYGEKNVAQGETGFKRLWRPQEELDYGQLTDQSIAIAGLQMAQTVRDNKWSPSDVAAVFIAGDALPFGPDDKDGTVLKQRFLEAAGLTHLDPASQVSLKGLACNSGADELLDALNPRKHPELQGRPTLIHAQSTLFNEVAKYPDRSLQELMDPFSPQVFSLGAVTIGTKPGETMSLVLAPDGRSMAVVDEEYDVKQALAAKTPFDNLLPPIDPGKPVKVRHEIAPNVVLGRMPPTKAENRILDMNALLTAGLFPRGTAKRIIRYVQGVHGEDEGGFAYDLLGFNDYYPEGKLDEIVIHHASYGVGQGIEGKLNENGIYIPMYWVNEDGNAPPTNTLMALARRLPHLGNKNVLIVSFGGGATYTIYAIRLGPHGASPEVVGGLKAA